MLRRSVSVAVVRGQALCLLERLAHLGPGARAASQRRQATLTHVFTTSIYYGLNVENSPNLSE